MLATQVQYWANQEQKRHNLATEGLTNRELGIKDYDAKTRRIESSTNQAKLGLDSDRVALESINALTAQTEAKTRQLAQETNEARRLQDYDIALRNLDIGLMNAQSTAASNYARAEQARVETQFIPYSTGANIAGTLVNAGSKLVSPVKGGFKAVKSGINSLLYNLRN